MRKTSLILITLLLTLLWVVPTFTVVTNAAETPEAYLLTTTQVAKETATLTTEAVTTSQGGVQPISPEKVQGKVDALENYVIALMAPIIHLLSKLSLILVAVLLLVAVFARQLIGRAFMIIGCVILGVAVFTNASIITDQIQYLGQWLGQ